MKFHIFVSVNSAEYITKRFPSPLRYPGGKSSLTSFLADVITTNSINGGTYCEGFAGGAGAALGLLLKKKVEKIVLNDADLHIYAFWDSILNHSNEFIDKLKSCPINLDEWYVQRAIYEDPKAYSILEVGFSTFFLNRSNKGGILPKAGPTGGFAQNGTYKIDARFRKDNLIPRLKKVYELREQIDFYSMDAVDFMNNVVLQLNKSKTLIYLDPPYYAQGRNLYLSYYREQDHKSFAKLLKGFDSHYWIVSYDNTPEISKLYSKYRSCEFDINYSVQTARKGKEMMFFSENLTVPQNLNIGQRTYSLVEI